MQTSKNNFNGRISDVENKITNLESKVEETKKTKADYDTLNDLEAKTYAALDKLKKNSYDDLEEYAQKANHKSRVDALMIELYSKKLTFRFKVLYKRERVKCVGN